MVKINIEHFFPDITPQQFYDMLMDPAYDDALEPVLGVKRRKVMERTEDDDKIYRKVIVVPGFPVPGPVQRIFGGKELEYLEESTFHKKRLVMDWSSLPNLFPDKVVAKGQVLVKQEGSGVRRTIVGDITVHILGVGGIMERAVKEGVDRSYEKASGFTQQWIREGKHKKSPSV